MNPNPAVPQLGQPAPTRAPQPGDWLSRPRLAGLLRALIPQPGAPASSLYLRAGAVQDFLRSPGESGSVWAERLRQSPDSVVESETGLVGLQAGERSLFVLPPFPLPENRVSPDWEPAPLLELLDAEYLIGVVLLRLGRFSVAVYRGETLVSSKTDARYVKGRHRAGGSSQRRFERIREGQMRKIYDKTCAAARAQFEPVARDLDYLALGGERQTLNGFLKVCPIMEQFSERILPRRLNIRDPKRDTLETVGQMLTESRVYPVDG